ncbi:MAG: D-alanyl-D-alanine carboxypeptidase [Candidatus Taylorbacteria bacterium]|nr:D-alanyl-D-alanine carboxypeptidase [Candidatus Taylorbacteria bacterium]
MSLNPKATAWLELGLLALLLALFLWLVKPTAPSTESASVPSESAERRFPQVEIEAKSAYVYDVSTGKALFEKEAELQWPLASLTKLMSALAAKELIPEYMLVRITSEDLREEGDTGLLVDEEWKLGKLIDYSLVVSSNDGMRALASVAGSQAGRASTTEDGSAQEAFVRKMNEISKRIGLTETYFLNQSGLDVSKTLSGGYGSAKDMAKLVEYILKTDPHLLEATSYGRTNISSNNATHDATNTNRSISTIPNVIASKTGYTDLSGGNVVVAWNAGIGRPIIIAVLGSSYEGRFEDLDKLVDATVEFFSTPATSTPPLDASL